MDINLDYRPHKYQKMLHEAAAKYEHLVVCAGRQSGKSKFARMQVLLSALHDPGLYWIVNPTYKQGKMIHWREFKKEIPPEIITYKNEQELSIELLNGARIEIKGADNENNLRGATNLKGIILDEAAFQQPHVWEDILEPLLLSQGGWVIFISTPHGFNWFYELWLRGQEGTKGYQPDWKSFRFTSYDNSTIPNNKEKLDKRRLSVDEDTFSSEYLAEFKKFKGLIYKSFDRKIHVITPFEIPNDGRWEVYRGIDFGFDNPTACIWIAINSEDNKWYVIDEYYETKESSDYHCGIILSKSGQYPSATISWGDPSAPQVMTDWAKKGVYITPARRDAMTNRGEWVGAGIDIIQEKLKVSVVDQKPQLFVFKNCENLIREFEAYEWEEPKDEILNNPGRPKKANDHALDALRYFACSYMGIQRVYLPPDNKNWSFR